MAKSLHNVNPLLANIWSFGKDNAGEGQFYHHPFEEQKGPHIQIGVLLWTSVLRPCSGSARMPTERRGIVGVCDVCARRVGRAG